MSHLRDLLPLSTGPACSGPRGTLFSRTMTVHLEQCKATSGKTIQLTIEVECNTNEIRREISIRVLDCGDPFFIYLYLIDSAEYEKIKSSQNLLISFDLFPKKLIKLLELCCENTGSPKIPSASEDFIRNTFCASFRKLKSENEALVRKVSGLEDELLSATLAKAKEVQNLQNDFDNERGYLEKRLADLERDLKAEKERYSESERGLKSKLCKLQLELRSREDLIEKSQTEHEQRSGEMRDRFSQELSRKSAKVKDLEEKLKDLAEELEQIKIAKEKSNQNWQKCELESSVVRGDLAKANQIIRKLQNEVKSSHGRLSLLNQVAHRQEEMAGVKESTVERLANDLKLCLQQLKSKDRDIERMRSEVKSLQAKCSESEVQLTAHQQVIASLNQELDSARLADPAILASGVAKINAERRCRGPRVPSGTRKTVDFDSNPVETNPKNGLFLHLDSEPPLREVMLRKTNQFSSANVLSKANKRRVF